MPNGPSCDCEGNNPPGVWGHKARHATAGMCNGIAEPPRHASRCGVTRRGSRAETRLRPTGYAEASAPPWVTPRRSPGANFCEYPPIGGAQARVCRARSLSAFSLSYRMRAACNPPYGRVVGISRCTPLNRQDAPCVSSPPPPEFIGSQNSLGHMWSAHMSLPHVCF